MSNGKTRAMTFGVSSAIAVSSPATWPKAGGGHDRSVGKAGHTVVAPTPEDTKYGAVETRAEAAQCADLFKRHRETLDGVIVTLPNFGDERAIADTLRMAGLNVPVLDAGHAGCARIDDDHRPPRQLLRQDVGLQ